jgi:hypothetical protein
MRLAGIGEVTVIPVVRRPPTVRGFQARRAKQPGKRSERLWDAGGQPARANFAVALAAAHNHNANAPAAPQKIHSFG